MLSFSLVCFFIAPILGCLIQGNHDSNNIKDEYIILLKREPSEHLRIHMMSTVKTKIQQDVGPASIKNTYIIGSYQVLHVKSSLVERILALADMEEVKSVCSNTEACATGTTSTLNMGSSHLIPKSSVNSSHTITEPNPRTTTETSTPNSKIPVPKASCEVQHINLNNNEGHWGLGRIMSRERICMNSEVTYSHRTDESGAGVTVYVFDTGINFQHSEFSDRASHFYKDPTIDEGNSDENGHGTHVAGLIGGVTHGTAKGVSLKSVKVMNKTRCGTTKTITGGLEAVFAEYQFNKQKSVCSLSISIADRDDCLDALISEAVQGGLPFIVSAGNTHKDACNNSLSGNPSVITVGSTSKQDQLSESSNYGPCVDILAPGECILSAWHDSNDGSNILSGTSMSCPYVTGIVARHLQRSPDSPSPESIKQWLINNATSDKVDITYHHSDAKQTPNKLVYWEPCHNDSYEQLTQNTCEGLGECDQDLSAGGAETIIVNLWILLPTIIFVRWTLI